MQSAPGNPGLHQGAETTRTTAWRGQQYFGCASQYETPGATVTWDCNQQVRFLNITANTTVTFPTNPRMGATYILVLKQDSTGSRTYIFSAQVGYGGGTWKWPGGTGPTGSGANKRDVLTFIFDGTDMLGVAALNY
jgi:hypothetical protein